MAKSPSQIKETGALESAMEAKEECRNRAGTEHAGTGPARPPASFVDVNVSDAINRRLNEHEYFMVTTKQRLRKLKGAIIPRKQRQSMLQNAQHSSEAGRKVSGVWGSTGRFFGTVLVYD